MNGNCIDCGNEYQLDALNLDLRCAACVEQCDCVNYLQELKTSAKRLVQLAKEREEMK